MKIRWFFPEKYNKKWIGLLIVYTLVLFCLLTGIRFWGITPQPDLSWAAGVLLFSLLVSLLICGFGYLGLRFVFSLTSLGIVTGIILMIISVNSDRNGWEDLLGVVLFLEFSVIGLAVGVISELIAFFTRRMRDKRQ